MTPAQAGAVVALRESEFEQFRALLYRIAGISLSSAKMSLVSSRLAKRLKHHGLADYGDYYRLITARDGAPELQVAIDLLTTNETHFFREPKHFDFLRQRLASLRRPGHALRIWSAACSSGEEVYSIAMLLDEALGAAGWEVLGSDLSTQVLAKAGVGQYPMTRAAEMPRPYLNRYCLKGTGPQEGTLLIARALRDRVRFLQHNLTGAASGVGEFDVIFLRNVMIYFDRDTQRQVVRHLLPSLRRGGYLLIGHSESLTGITEELRQVAPAVYQKPDA